MGRARRRRRRRGGADREARRRLRLLHRARRGRARPPVARAVRGARRRRFTRSGSARTRRALTHVDRTTRADDHDGRAEAPADGAAAARRLRRRSSSSPATSRRSARRARRAFLAATPRELETCARAECRLDLLVGSGTDPGEHYDGGLDVGLFVRHRGLAGRGCGRRAVRGAAAAGPARGHLRRRRFLRGQRSTFALARGDSLPDALELAARAGAAVITGKGPYSAQITL